MNKYSAALRHINIKDVRQKHQQKLIEQKNKEEKEKEEEKYIASVMGEKKYDWRVNSMTLDEETKTDVKIKSDQRKLIKSKVEKKPKYSWREELQKDKKKYFVEGMTTSDVFYTNLPSEGAIDLVSSDVDINFSGGTPGEIGSPSEGFYARSEIIGPVDTTRYDTIGITVTVNSSIDFGEGLILTSVGGLSGATVILSPGSTSGTYYARLPFTSSSSSYRLIQVVSNVGSSTFTINNISYQRRSPKNVVVPLDSPEASAFIRTGSGDLSPEEKLQELKDMLKAGDEYVQQVYGDEFPGTGAVPPGESGITPGVQTIDYGEIAQYTDDPSTWPSIKNPVKTPPPIIDPKTGWPSVPNVPPSYRGKPGGQPVRLAHYKPKGRLISEKNNQDKGLTPG